MSRHAPPQPDRAEEHTREEDKRQRCEERRQGSACRVARAGVGEIRQRCIDNRCARAEGGRIIPGLSERSGAVATPCRERARREILRWATCMRGEGINQISCPYLVFQLRMYGQAAMLRR